MVFISEEGVLFMNFFPNYYPLWEENKSRDITTIEDTGVKMPSEIIVHMGHPDRPARNIRVSFLDYLRKVASGEVSPNAHVEAKKAMILWINSFILNRLNTEFYKGQGKDFDITNIPSVDLRFDPNQVLQAETVEIVDELIGQYIATRGKTYPKLLLPSFDLSKANRLAKTDQKNHMEILFHFYDQKYGPLELRMAEPINGIHETFPGHDLQLGTKGSEVRLLQKRLNLIKTKYPVIPNMTEDGIFGPNTAKAVTLFQSQVLGIQPTGIVNRRLWYRIGFYYWTVMGSDRSMTRQRVSPTQHRVTHTGQWVPVFVPMWVWKSK